MAIHGDVAVVGAAGNDEPDGAGAAYVVRRGGDGVWRQEQLLRSSAPFERENFGRLVAVHENAVVVGAYSVLGSTTRGTASLFVQGAGAWVERQRYVPGQALGSSSYFATAFAVASDDLVLTDPSLNFRGTTYFYDINAR